MSPALEEQLPYRNLIVSDDASIAIMVNEEDHLRIQSMAPGLKLQQAYNHVVQIDKAIEAKYNALHVEFFDSEEDAPEMDPVLVEELEAINKVKNTLNNIHSAEEKRIEIRKELEGLGYDFKNMACQHQM